jgi:hypothetical protein
MSIVHVNGHNIPHHQQPAAISSLRHETMSVPSSTVPSFGSQFSISFTSKNVQLEEMILEFYVSALSGLTVSNSGTAAYVSAWFWPSRIDMYLGSQLIDSIYGLNNMLLQQVDSENDELRSLKNSAAGTWNSHTSRATASSSSGYWYLPLHTIFNQSAYKFVVGSPDLQLRVTMNSLADSYSLTSGSTATGTPASTFYGCNLIARVTHLPPQIVAEHTNYLSRTSLTFPFLETVLQTTSLTSGSTSYSVLLSGVTGMIPFFFIVIRGANPTGSSQYTFTGVSTFNLLDGSSSPLLGGTVIKDSFNRLVMTPRWMNNTTFSDLGSGCYFYSFAMDPQSSIERASNTGGYQFRGNETLQLTFSSSLSANSQVDFIAYRYAGVNVQGNNIKKVAL